MPQFAIHFEAEDKFLVDRAKDLPASVVEGTHWNDQGMNRRIKEYRAKNNDANNVQDFMRNLIGPANVLAVDVSKPEDDQLLSMKEIIEQKGKPCCINMISDSDRKYLDGLDKAAKKAAKAKAREEAQLAKEQALSNPPTTTDRGGKEAKDKKGKKEEHHVEEQQDVNEALLEEEETEEEVDEIEQIIQQEEAQAAERQQREAELKKQQELEKE